MGIAVAVYMKTGVGAQESCVSGTAGMPGLEAFQAVTEEFQALEAEGLIKITTLHHESQTGRRLVDLVRFQRIL